MMDDGWGLLLSQNHREHQQQDRRRATQQTTIPHTQQAVRRVKITMNIQKKRKASSSKQRRKDRQQQRLPPWKKKQALLAKKDRGDTRRQTNFLSKSCPWQTKSPEFEKIFQMSLSDDDGRSSLLGRRGPHPQQGRGLPQLQLLLLLLMMMGSVKAFLLPTLRSGGFVVVRPRPSSSPPHFMVPNKKRGGGAGAGAGGKKPKKQRKYPNPKLDRNKSGGPDNKKKKSRSSSSSSSSSSPTTTTKKQKQQQGNNTPPWQVISKKDMAQNIQAELERRVQAQTNGIHQTVEEMEQNKQQYTRSIDFLHPADKSIVTWKRFAPSISNKYDYIFHGSFLHQQPIPRLGVPEIAFLGRSNVGKSSLLNKLLHTDIARVGKTPGATASVNLYSMNYRSKKGGKDTTTTTTAASTKSVLGLVDLPGFGYAKLSHEVKESVQLAAEHYLGNRKELFLGILLVDIRRIPSDDDRAVLAALFDMGLPIVVVATKSDKISTIDKRNVALEVIRTELGLPEGQPLCISSVTGQGIKDMWQIIMEACETGVEEYRDRLETGGTSSLDMEEELSGTEDEEYDDEDDEIAYSQGFDWIHDSAILYEGEEEQEEYGYGAEEFEEGPEEWDKEGSSPNSKLREKNVMEEDRENGPLQSIKFLRKKAKDMERKGQI